MAANDIWRLSMVGDWSATEQAVVTAHVKFLSGAATFDGAAAYFKTNLLDLLKTLQSNGWNWRYVNGITVNVNPPQSGTYITGFPLTGTQASDSLPYTTALVTSLRTNYAGRSYRGRMYIPALSENSNAAGRCIQATVNSVQTYFEDLVAALGYGGSNADYQWGVYSRLLSQFYPFTAPVVREVWGTVRRRRPGVGI